MSWTSYTAFRTNVSTWLDIGTSDLGATLLDDLITTAEKRIYREVKAREMETALSSTISSGAVTVPSDYGQMKYAYLDGTPTKPLERRSAEWIYNEYRTRSSDAKPKFFAREGGSFIFGPYPDSGYLMKGIYYKKFPALSTSLNDLFNNNPDLFLWAALAESESILGRDKRVALWEAKYQNSKNRINYEHEDEDMSGSTSTGLA
jgi:hypothetical protein